MSTQSITQDARAESLGIRGIYLFSSSSSHHKNKRVARMAKGLAVFSSVQHQRTYEPRMGHHLLPYPSCKPHLFLFLPNACVHGASCT